MEKKITITINEGEGEISRHQFVRENITSFEALGILRFYEKKLWIDTVNEMEQVTPEPPSKSEGNEQGLEG